MKTIEEIIRSYKNSISLEPYGWKEFQKYPELQEQINMYIYQLFLLYSPHLQELPLS